MRSGILILAGVVAAAAALGWYQYSADQTRQQGFVFGNELQQIQDDLKQLQTQFYSSITSWEEGEIGRDELLTRLNTHMGGFEEVISRYDGLRPPEVLRPPSSSSGSPRRLRWRVTLNTSSGYPPARILPSCVRTFS